jgi:hypothetical protein
LLVLLSSSAVGLPRFGDQLGQTGADGTDSNTANSTIGQGDYGDLWMRRLSGDIGGSGNVTLPTNAHGGNQMGGQPEPFNWTPQMAENEVNSMFGLNGGDYSANGSAEAPLNGGVEKLPSCGGSDEYCIVEYDANGDGVNECCNNRNNDVCAKCLDYCKGHCAETQTGVRTCFTDGKNGVVCDCSKEAPTCYSTKAQTPSTSTLSKAQEQVGNSNPPYYILMFALMMVASAAAAYFSSKKA